jgi:hypothetical protein
MRAAVLRDAMLPDLNDLWRETFGDPDICIAILDGSIDVSHPAFARANLVQHDALGRAANAGQLGREHGTHIASIIFGSHGGPIAGIAPECRGVVIPIYADDGAKVSCSQEDLAKAINEAIRLGAQIINVSGGELARDDAASPELRLAIRNCIDENRVVVAAAGNDGCRACLHLPGAVPSVLAVGAVDARGRPLNGSNWGEIYQIQGIVAPGESIPGAMPGGGVAPRSGTSFAAAIVSGVAGLLLSLQKKRGETPDPFMVREALVRTAQGCAKTGSADCDRLLAGRLNVRGAIEFLTRGFPTMTLSATTPNESHDNLEPSCDLPRREIPGDVDDAPVGAAPSAAPHRPHGPPAETPSAAIGPSSAVSPSSGCGCKGTGQKVYVIGELDIDFVSLARRDSLQANAPGLPRMYGFDNAIENRDALLRYLLGINLREDAEDIRAEVRKAVEQARSGAMVNGNFYDTDSIHWVLKQGECPLYVIRPQGPFAVAAYHQLVIFLIEQTYDSYVTFTNAAVNDECLDSFYPCYGGTQEPLRDSLSHPDAIESAAGGEGAEAEAEAETRLGSAEVVARALTLFNEPRVSASHVAIAGEITGRVRLLTGEEVEVINPVMRGMQNWNTRRLLEVLLQMPALNLPNLNEHVAILALKIISQLYELVRNPGKDPCDRAKNFMATKELFKLALTLANPVFLSMLGVAGPAGQNGGRLEVNAREFLNIALDTLLCKPSRCVRYGSEPYEVELSFYNFANQFMGNAVVSQTIDVSDVVPVPIDTPRVFARRSFR